MKRLCVVIFVEISPHQRLRPSDPVQPAMSYILIPLECRSRLCSRTKPSRRGTRWEGNAGASLTLPDLDASMAGFGCPPRLENKPVREGTGYHPKMRIRLFFLCFHCHVSQHRYEKSSDLLRSPASNRARGIGGNQCPKCMKSNSSVTRVSEPNSKQEIHNPAFMRKV